MLRLLFFSNIQANIAVFDFVSFTFCSIRTNIDNIFWAHLHFIILVYLIFLLLFTTSCYFSFYLLHSFCSILVMFPVLCSYLTFSIVIYLYFTAFLSLSHILSLYFTQGLYYTFFFHCHSHLFHCVSFSFSFCIF